LLEAVASGQRVLVGFDFSYGYAAGLAKHLNGQEQSGWKSVWDFLAANVLDDAQNHSNRFEVAAQLNGLVNGIEAGPFWGHPAKRSFEGLRPKRPVFPFTNPHGLLLAHLRLCEQRMPGVQESWKLFGNGAVGSQTLVGIPYVNRLRFAPEFSEISRVWPFETGFDQSLARNARNMIVHAEIWPGVIESRVADRLTREPNAIKDALQVSELCNWARELDRAGTLAPLFAAPADLTAPQYNQCTQEEGWILGAR
jgi:precorrin-8X/cobalt-precorrin-8 methylmutase